MAALSAEAVEVHQLPDDGEALDCDTADTTQERRTGGELLAAAPIAIAGLKTISKGPAPINSGLAI